MDARALCVKRARAYAAAMGDATPDAEIARILRTTRMIAMVGASLDPSRPSHDVGHFLVEQGYRVIPVNPSAAGQMLFGEPIRASLAEVDAADMVDIFRRSEAVPEVVDAALKLPGLRTIWMQLGVHNPYAAHMARSRGLAVVEDRCPKIEIARLGLSR